MSSDIEKKAGLWMGLALLVLSTVYIFVVMGKTQWVTYIAIAFGIFISLFLYVQAGVVEYFRKKEFRRLGFGDAVVWFSVIIATLVLINTLLLINGVSNAVPDWLRTFSQYVGVTTGVVAGLLSIMHMALPRFK